MSDAFDNYLLEKNINPELFVQSEPELYQRFDKEFEHMHPKSFTEQKKFFINDLRKKYQHKDFNSTEALQKAQTVSSSPKPIFRKK